MSAVDDRLIDDYVERLRRELEASPEEAEEVLREIRSHLECAARDIEGNGGDKATGQAGALERFGTAKHIGQELRQVHGRATWQEAGLAVLPLLLFAVLATMPQAPIWIAPLLLAAATALGWRAG